MSWADFDAAMPDKAEARRKIIGDVLTKHSITRAELFGKDRTKEFCDARRDAIVRLKDAGFSPGRIAQIMNRERTTIVHCLSKPMLVRKREKHRVYKILWSLAPDVREVVKQYAEAEQVSPQAIIKEWIAERAQCERAAKISYMRGCPIEAANA